jgi:hypothetical protein
MVWEVTADQPDESDFEVFMRTHERRLALNRRIALEVQPATERDYVSREGEDMRRRIITTLTGVLLAMMLVIPAASAKNTPNPFPVSDEPGCLGTVNATINHDSGMHEHGNDSRGPGYYFRPGGLAADDDPLTTTGGQFTEALAGVRAEVCI